MATRKKPAAKAKASETYGAENPSKELTDKINKSASKGENSGK